jgi:ribose transport system substrate-binding protein
MKKWMSLLLVPFLALAGCGAPDSDRINVAYVTNGVASFWTIAKAGALKGGEDYDVDVRVLMPVEGIVDQNRMVENLLVTGVDGVAISPIDAANQVDLLNNVADKTFLITQDSDAPDSNRLCFIGMNNYKAGREAGKMVKQTLPEGGKVIIFVGRLEQLNAQQRRQGVIDELMDRPMQSMDDMKTDPNGKPITGDKYTVFSTMTDNFDFSKAKSNAEDSIVANSDLKCMVGLFAYNMPACLEAVKESGKLGTIKLVSFDEDDATLQGIIDGHIYGTVSQQPFVYGYESVRVLAALARGDESVLPEGGVIDIDAILVTKENVEGFWADLKELTGGA